MLKTSRRGGDGNGDECGNGSEVEGVDDDEFGAGGEGGDEGGDEGGNGSEDSDNGGTNSDDDGTSSDDDSTNSNDDSTNSNDDGTNSDNNGSKYEDEGEDEGEDKDHDRENRNEDRIGDLEDYGAVVEDLLLNLWTQEWSPSEVNSIGDPTVCYLALSSLRSQSTWAHPRDITPTIARLMYCIKALILPKSHRRAGTGRTTTSVKAFKAAYAKLAHWHHEKEDSTFNTLSSFQALASSIALQTMSMPVVGWLNTQRTEFIYDGYHLTVDRLREMVRMIQRQTCKVFVEDVLLGLPLKVEYGNIMDKLTKRTQGYSFVDDNKWLLHPDSFIDKILSDTVLRAQFVVRWADPREGGRPGQPVWNEKRLYQWLEAYDKFHRLLMTCVLMMAGSPPRGTELTCIRIRNAATQTRGLYVMGQYVAVVCQYSKTTLVTSRDKLIIHALDGITADLVIQDLALCREVAKVFIRNLYPNQEDQGRVCTYNDYLFVKKGGRLFSTEDLTDVLQGFYQEAVGAPFGVQDSRHIFIALRRAHCPEFDRLIEADTRDTVGALQVGHNRAVENNVYGVLTSSIIQLSEEMVPLFLKVSLQFQAFLRIPIGGQVFSHLLIQNPRAYEQSVIAGAASLEPEECDLVRAIKKALAQHSCGCDQGHQALNALLPALAPVEPSGDADYSPVLHQGNRGERRTREYEEVIDGRVELEGRRAAKRLRISL